MERYKTYVAPTENTNNILTFMFSWRFSPFRHRCEKLWYSYRIIEVSGVPFPAKSSFSWKSWFTVKFTDFREIHRIAPETAIFTKMLVSQKGAPRKHQETITFIKDSGAGGGGSWISTENMKILEILRKTQKCWKITTNQGNHQKSRNPENGDLWHGKPSRKPAENKTF